MLTLIPLKKENTKVLSFYLILFHLTSYLTLQTTLLKLKQFISFIYHEFSYDQMLEIEIGFSN